MFEDLIDEVTEQTDVKEEQESVQTVNDCSCEDCSCEESDCAKQHHRCGRSYDSDQCNTVKFPINNKDKKEVCVIVACQGTISFDKKNLTRAAYEFLKDVKSKYEKMVDEDV
jgi:hypothetical protein